MAAARRRPAAAGGGGDVDRGARRVVGADGGRDDAAARAQAGALAGLSLAARAAPAGRRRVHAGLPRASGSPRAPRRSRCSSRCAASRRPSRSRSRVAACWHCAPPRRRLLRRCGILRAPAVHGARAVGRLGARRAAGGRALRRDVRGAHAADGDRPSPRAHGRRGARARERAAPRAEPRAARRAPRSRRCGSAPAALVAAGSRSRPDSPACRTAGARSLDGGRWDGPRRPAYLGSQHRRRSCPSQAAPCGALSAH